MKNFIKNIIYIGVFTPNLKLQGKLANEAKEPHLTLKFRPTEDEINKILYGGKTSVEIFLMGYECTQNNEGLKVQIPEPLFFYNNLKNPFLTISWSNDSSPVKTGELKFEEEIPQFYLKQLCETCRDDLYGGKSIEGKIGFFLKGGKIIFMEDLIHEESFYFNFDGYKCQQIFDKKIFFKEEEYYDDILISEISEKEYNEALKKHLKENSSEIEEYSIEEENTYKFCFTTWNGKKDYIKITAESEDEAEEKAWKKHANFTKNWKDPDSYKYSDIELLY